jgi:hypothetical protein
VDTPHAGSLYIHAHEPVTRGQDILYMLRARAPIDAERLGGAWERQVRARPTLQLRWKFDGAAEKYCWVPFEEAELDARILTARDAMRTIAARSQLGAFAPSGEGLVYRLLRAGESTLACRASHMFTNGLGLATWLDDLLRFEKGEAPGADGGAALRARPPWRALGAAAGTARALLFALRFKLAAGSGASRETADLTGGRAPATHKKGLTVVRCQFSEAASARLRDAGKARGLSVTGSLAAATARAFLALRPESRRVLMGLNVDLRRYETHKSWMEPGNPTGGHLIQIFRGAEVDREVARSLEIARRGTPYWLARAMDRPAKSDVKLLESFSKRVREPIPARAPFENLSCLLSSVAVPGELTEFHRAFAGGMFVSWTQMPLIGLFTCGGTTTFSLSSPDDLVDPADAEALAELILDQLDSARDGERELLHIDS